MLVTVFALFSAMAYWQRGEPGNTDPLRSLVFVAIVLAGVGFLQIRRMSSATDILSKLTVSVVEEGVEVNDQSTRTLFKLGQIDALHVSRTYFSANIVRVELCLGRGKVVLPPLERSDEFLGELRSLLPDVPCKEKRHLFI